MSASIQSFLNQIFSGSHYRQTRDGVEIDDAAPQGNCWIVARSECVFLKLDLSGISREKRLPALAAQLELLSPFNDTAHWVYWVDGYATVWVWDRAVQQEQMESSLRQGDQMAVIEVFPESAFSEIREGGSYLFRSLDGYVAQTWDSGRLVAEAYWSDLPDQGGWEAYCRSNGLPQGSLPDVQPELVSRTTPLREDQVLNLGVNLKVVEPWAFLGISSILLFCLAFQTVSLLKLSVSVQLLRDEVHSVRTEVMPSVSLRDDALRLKLQNERLAELDADTQLMTMVSVLEAMTEEGLVNESKLTDWKMDSETLEMTLRSPTSELEQYAQALDNIFNLSGAKLTPREKQDKLEISAQVSANER